MDALSAAKNQDTAADALDDAEWTVAEGEIRVQTELSKTMLPMVINAEAEKLVQDALRDAGAGALKLVLLPGRRLRRREEAEGGEERERAGEGDGASDCAAGADAVQCRDSERDRSAGQRLRGLRRVERVRWMMDFSDLGKMKEMMGQAKQMQEQMEKKLAATVVEASSGGGVVTVRMNGKKEVLRVKIEPTAMGSTASDLELLEDLIAAAVNEAGRRADEAMKSSVAGMMGGLGLPDLPGLG